MIELICITSIVVAAVHRWIFWMSSTSAFFSLASVTRSSTCSSGSVFSASSVTGTRIPLISVDRGAIPLSAPPCCDAVSSRPDLGLSAPPGIGIPFQIRDCNKELTHSASLSKSACVAGTETAGRVEPANAAKSAKLSLAGAWRLPSAASFECNSVNSDSLRMIAQVCSPLRLKPMQCITYAALRVLLCADSPTLISASI